MNISVPSLGLAEMISSLPLLVLVLIHLQDVLISISLQKKLASGVFRTSVKVNWMYSWLSLPFGQFNQYRIAPTSGLVDDIKTKRFVYQLNNSPALQDRFVRYNQTDLSPDDPFPVMPSVIGPFNLPTKLSAQDLQIRKSLIKTAFANNRYQLSLKSYLPARGLLFRALASCLGTTAKWRVHCRSGLFPHSIRLHG